MREPATVGSCLIVEDDEALGRSLVRLVGRHAVPALARTALAAKRLLDGPGAFVALLVDVRLPDESGLEVLRHARRAHPATPAMVLTGHIDPEVVNAAYDLNAICVAKPVVSERILRFLREGQSPGLAADLIVDAWIVRYELSRAEGDVLRMAILGDSKGSIAEARGSSQQTVKKQVANALRKTGDGSLLAATQRLLREALRAQAG